MPLPFPSSASSHGQCFEGARCGWARSGGLVRDSVSEPRPRLRAGVEDPGIAELDVLNGDTTLRRLDPAPQRRPLAVDPATGRLTPAGHAPTEAVPTAFGLDSRGASLFAAGTASGRLASFRVDGETGALTALETYAVGKRPAAVLAVPLSR